MWPDLRKGVLYTSDFATLMSHNFVCDQAITLKFHPHYFNNRKVFSPNFGAVAELQAELYLLKFEKFDVCIRPLFANPVTICVCAHY